jgi:hypothetical protein
LDCSGPREERDSNVGGHGASYLGREEA